MPPSASRAVRASCRRRASSSRPCPRRMETVVAGSTTDTIRTAIWSRNDMTISVDMPDGSVHDFPDNTPPEKIRLALQDYVYRQGVGRVGQGLSGLDEGLANLLGA